LVSKKAAVTLLACNSGNNTNNPDPLNNYIVEYKKAKERKQKLEQEMQKFYGF
jgi:hypothetical protein